MSVTADRVAPADVLIKKQILNTYPGGSSDPVDLAYRRLHAVLCLTAADDGTTTVTEERAADLAVLHRNRDARKAWNDVLRDVTVVDDGIRRMSGDTHPVVLIDPDGKYVLIADYLIPAWQLPDAALDNPKQWCDNVIAEATAGGLPAWQRNLLAKRLTTYATDLIENITPERADEHANALNHDIDRIWKEVRTARKQERSQAQRSARLAEQERTLREEVEGLQQVLDDYDQPLAQLEQARTLAQRVLDLCNQVDTGVGGES